MGGGAQTLALTSLLCLGLCWMPGDGAQAGALPKPSIWANPGPLVSMGSPVTLWCQGSLQAEVYRVYKEGSPQPWEVRTQQDSRHKADFPITMSMSSCDSGQYWCVYRTPLGLSQPSEPLTLVLTGMFLAPSLSAQPSLVVASGGNVSLSCRSEYDDARTAHLLKEGGAGPLHSLEARFSHVAGVWQATFHLGPMDSTQGGIYRCYRAHSRYPHVWSLPSEPLELQVTGEGPSAHGAWTLLAVGCSLHMPSSLPGMYRKPSLQAQPGPSVPWGVMVALLCGSQEPMDTFILHKVGSGAPPQHLHVPGSVMAAQATFTLGPVTSAHRGTYRCYGAHSTDPYLWSWPSDPLQVELSGEGPSPVSLVILVSAGLSTGEGWPGSPSAPAPQDHTLENLIRMGLAGFVLLGLGLLLAEAWYSHKRTRAAEWRPFSAIVVTILLCYYETNSSNFCPPGVAAPSGALELVVTEALTRPSIWAEPDSRIPEGKPAAIWCQGPPGAEEYQLRSEGGLSAWGKPERSQARGGVGFPIAAMTSRTAGRYRCFCRSGELWSEPSEPLDLVVTRRHRPPSCAGMYDTPTLWVQPGPTVTSGENVTFYCRLETVTNTFFLLREGGPSHAQGSHGAVPAEFPVGPVTLAHTGTYRCFGAYSGHVWSFPSEPVKLLVTDVGDPSLEPTDPAPAPAGSREPRLGTTVSRVQDTPAAWDHTAQNLLRIGLAVLVLVALMWLLAEDWLCRWRTQEGAGRAQAGMDCDVCVVLQSGGHLHRVGGGGGGDGLLRQIRSLACAPARPPLPHSGLP
ncbi:leukocyte immunoglobulin-like receptor subfamily A member 6 [Oryctolagus cuniculus]|uniref:leukocyte immunoglobulin-like receptor subfamily A member 6 n=1 Tax=Oryctolagus cuniculus TaxID=9986 RepID=UPI00387999E4